VKERRSRGAEVGPPCSGSRPVPRWRSGAPPRSASLRSGSGSALRAKARGLA
jgi:hypothetical protein